MRIRIKPVTEEVKKTDHTHGVMDVQPAFYGKEKRAPVATLEVLNAEDKILSVSRLTVDGKTGKMYLEDRSAPVAALCDIKPIEPVKPAGPSAEKK